MVRYTPEEQKVFLGMMESCGVCFKLRKLSDDEWEYIAPELLPEWSDAQEQLLGRLRDEPPTSELSARYAFLHDGILRDGKQRLQKDGSSGSTAQTVTIWPT
jgi:internalin A